MDEMNSKDSDNKSYEKLQSYLEGLLDNETNPDAQSYWMNVKVIIAILSGMNRLKRRFENSASDINVKMNAILDRLQKLEKEIKNFKEWEDKKGKE